VTSVPFLTLTTLAAVALAVTAARAPAGQRRPAIAVPLGIVLGIAVIFAGFAAARAAVFEPRAKAACERAGLVPHGVVYRWRGVLPRAATCTTRRGALVDVEFRSFASPSIVNRLIEIAYTVAIIVAGLVPAGFGVAYRFRHA
jgi:hypothetical protein